MAQLDIQGYTSPWAEAILTGQSSSIQPKFFLNENLFFAVLPQKHAFLALESAFGGATKGRLKGNNFFYKP